MMNIRCVVGGGVLSLLLSGMAVAGNNTSVTFAGGIVHLRGLIANGACVVSAGSENKQVDMGQVRSSQLGERGAWADPVAFSFQLIDCDTTISQQVGIVFSGVTDGKDPLVFKTGEGASAAQGVGIGLFDGAGDLIVPNTRPRHFTPLTDGAVTLPFTAKYRATSRDVVAGDASAYVYFSLYYP